MTPRTIPSCSTIIRDCNHTADSFESAYFTPPSMFCSDFSTKQDNSIPDQWDAIDDSSSNVHHEFRSTSSPHSIESSEIDSHLSVCANLPKVALSFSDEDDISDTTIHDIPSQTIPPWTSSETVAESQYTSTLNTTKTRHQAGFLHHRMENVILRSVQCTTIVQPFQCPYWSHSEGNDHKIPSPSR